MLSTNKLIFACIAILGNENNRESEQKKAIHPPQLLSLNTLQQTKMQFFGYPNPYTSQISSLKLGSS